MSRAVHADSCAALFDAVTARQLEGSVAARYAEGQYATTAPGNRTETHARLCIDCGEWRHWSGKVRYCPKCRRARDVAHAKARAAL